MTAADGEAAVNGRVTLAVINNNLGHLTDIVERMRAETADYRRRQEDRLRDIELCAGSESGRIDAALKAAEDAQTKADKAITSSSWWNGANSLGVIISGILGALGIQRP